MVDDEEVEGGKTKDEVSIEFSPPDTEGFVANDGNDGIEGGGTERDPPPPPKR